MSRNRVLLFALGLLPLLGITSLAQDVIKEKPQGGPPPLGIHWARGAKPAPHVENHR